MRGTGARVYRGASRRISSLHYYIPVLRSQTATAAATQVIRISKEEPVRTIEEGTSAPSLYRTSLLWEKVTRTWEINLMKGGSLRKFEHIQNVQDALSRVNIGIGLMNVKYRMDTLIPCCRAYARCISCCIYKPGVAQLDRAEVVSN
jgi:hypothetical protein